jgi:hypothetical protein
MWQIKTFQNSETEPKGLSKVQITIWGVEPQSQTWDFAQCKVVSLHTARHNSQEPSSNRESWYKQQIKYNLENQGKTPKFKPRFEFHATLC